MYICCYDDVFCDFLLLYYNIWAERFLVPLNGRREPRQALNLQLNFKLQGKYHCSFLIFL